MAVIVCPICATRYRVVDSQLSKASRLKCKKCKTVFPVSDNIVQTEKFSKGNGTLEISSPLEESSKISEQTIGAETLSPKKIPLQQDDDTAGGNLDDMSLDFGASVESPSAELDFSFSASIPEDSERTGNEEIHDHIMDDSQEAQGQIKIGLTDLTLEEEDGRDSEATLSMEHSLDFSFSAKIPESEAEEKMGEDEIPEESERVTETSSQDISLDGLGFGDISGGETVTLPGGRRMEPFVEDQETRQEVIEEPPGDKGVSQEEELLSTCCIDSLAMGLPKCEICGRNLKGKEGLIDQEIVQQRRQQLKEDLRQGDAQIGFSEESPGDKIIVQEEEDFTDVERALDALADGSFEKVIRRKEARRAATKRLKMIGILAGVVIVVAAVIVWSLLPSSHEKLISRYEELMSRQEVDPGEVVDLFLAAVSEQDQDIFSRLSVMQTMPNIANGTIVSIGEEYAETSLGSLGKDIQTLSEEIANLKKDYEEKEKEWARESSQNLTPLLIQENINSLKGKKETLQAEFDQKEAESAKKLVNLQRELDTAKQELEENRQRSQKYIDDTTELGKATYKASVRNIQALTEKIGKLEAQITQEEIAHRQRMQELEAEYNPRFAKLEEELQTQQALYEKATSLQDPEKSPLLRLDKEIKRLGEMINEKENTLREKEEQLENVKAFFKRGDQKNRVEKDQDTAEFVHVSRNVIASVKFRGSSKQQVPIVLKRYRAIIADQRIQGDWMVETILQ